MIDPRAIKKEILHCCVSLLIVFCVSFFLFPVFPVVPNYILVSLIVISFFVTDLAVFVAHMAILLLWAKYTPIISPELLYMAVVALCMYGLMRLLVGKKSFMAVMISVLIFQAIFWALFFQNAFAGSISFYMEFLYNGVFALILYGVHIWIQKNYY